MSDNMQDTNGVLVQGHIKIFDPESQKKYTLTNAMQFIMRI
jgi:hypothetical protein